VIDAFPLCWPDGWPRTPSHQRKAAPYQVTFARARDELLNELRLGGCRNVIISSNLALRRDGIPYADCREPSDPGIAVYWDNRKGEPKQLGNDCWRTVRENLRAVGLAYSGLRLIERTGSTALLDRAYAGFARLPAGDAIPKWWEVLGVDPELPKDLVRAAYLTLVREQHPDHGGNAVTMARINRAYEEAMSA
jgi:hypothetical protein